MIGNEEPRYKTGKLPAEPIGTKIRFGDIFVNLPRPPMVFGHQDLMGSEPWHMLGNDEVGNCVFAAAAHDLYLWSLIGHGPRVRITTLDTFSDYHAVTGFIPGYPSTDRGTKMADAVEYYRSAAELVESLAGNPRVTLHTSSRAKAFPTIVTRKSARPISMRAFK